MSRKLIIFFVATTLLVLLFSALFIRIQSQQIPVVVKPDELIEINGVERNYRLVIPRKLPKSCPLVIAFHGTGDSPKTMASYSQLDFLAGQNQFLLVYPAARNAMWKTTDLDANNLANNSDIQFITQLVNALVDRYSISKDQIYLVGMSNGARFVQILAESKPSLPAAIVAHSGSRPQGLPFQSVNSRFSIVLVAGQDDPVIDQARSDYQRYLKNGYTAELIEVSGLGHQWSVRHNQKIWELLTAPQSNDPKE